MNGSVQCAWLRVALQSPNQKRTIDEWNSYLQKIAIFVNRPVGPYGDNWDLSPLDFMNKSSLLFQSEGLQNGCNCVRLVKIESYLFGFLVMTTIQEGKSAHLSMGYDAPINLKIFRRTCCYCTAIEGHPDPCKK